MNKSLFQPAIWLLAGLLLASACSAPAAMTGTPPEAPPQPTPSPDTAALGTAAPGTASPDAPAPPQAGEQPAIVTEIKLDLYYNPALYPCPLAIDPQARQLYVSGVPSRTFVLSTVDWLLDATLKAGGNLALDALNGRLFVGTPAGLDVYSSASHAFLTHIELARALTTTVTPQPPVIPWAGPSRGDVYAIQADLYRVLGVGLSATPVMKQVDKAREVRAIAVDENRAVVYASLNNGIPGSNNRNDLWRFDMQASRSERLFSGVLDFTLDPVRGRVIATVQSSRSSLGELQVWGGAPLTRTHRLSNVSGQLALDSTRDRLYVLSIGQRTRLMVLQAGTLALLADMALPGPYTAMAMDEAGDRLYLLSDDGYILVVSGHGQRASAQALQVVAPPAAPVLRLAASPDESTLFGLWGSDAARGGVLLSSRDGGATWSPMGGALSEMDVTDLAMAAPHTLFAATQRGVYRSSDGGRSWQPANSGLDDMWIVRVALSPAYEREPVAFAVSFSGAAYRSRDGGRSWQPLAERYGRPIQAANALALSPDFERDRTLFLGTKRTPDRLLVSRDAGGSWTFVMSATVSGLYPSPGMGRDGLILGVFEQQGLLRSTDSGKAWGGALRGVRGASGQDLLALSPAFERDRTALLLARASGQLYRSTDGGENWQLSASPLAAQVTALLIAGEGEGQSAWLGTRDGQVQRVAMSELGWVPLEASFRQDTLPAGIESIALSPGFEQDGGLFAAGKDVGVWASVDGGRTWRDTGFPAREVGISRVHLAVSPNFASDRTLYAATGSLLYRSTDGGQSWYVLPLKSGNLFPINDLAVSPVHDGAYTVILAGDYRWPSVLRSTDRGQSWEWATKGLPRQVSLNLVAFSPEYATDHGLYVWGESDGLYRSGDGGRNWERVYRPDGNWLVQSFALSPEFGRDRLMFLGTLKEKHNVYRSADGGASWRPTELGLPLELVWASALALSPQFGHDRTVFLGTDQGVYRSSDGGQMWRLAVNLPEVVDLAISPGVDGRQTVFAVSARDGVYVSTDGGEQWQPVGK
ncbi:MAG: hypothetical protein JW850_22040 [Thermoflexales bacterium]|nr:hypothetical protein [Thermoflexales bacterium]